MSTTVCHLSVLVRDSLTVHETICNDIFLCYVCQPVLCVICCALDIYRSNSCRSASRWMAKLEALAVVWCPLRGARVKLQWTLKFPSQRGTKHSAACISFEISGGWNMGFYLSRSCSNIEVTLLSIGLWKKNQMWSSWIIRISSWCGYLYVKERRMENPI